MNLTVQEVSSKKDLKKFIQFPFELYRNNECYVPPIIDFEISTLLKSKNPAFEVCEACYWVVKSENKIVGRIAAIVHHKEFEEHKKARFGWIDFIDDAVVFDLLMQTAENWARSKGCLYLHGPMGFTDLDFEGALVSGYDKMATQATIYNFPYYIQHYKRYGFAKSCDWVEVRGHVPSEIPRKLTRTASLVGSRFNLEIKRFKKSKEVIPYAAGVFHVLNEAYSHLYGYYPLTEKQIQYYIKQYFDFIRIDFVTLVVNEKDEVIGFAISLPSLSKAFQRAKGRLFPFGFIHVLKAFNNNQHVDMFLIGVLPAYQKLGANVLIFHEMMSNYIKFGVKYVSTGPMMEDNRGVLNLWSDYQDSLEEITIRRRCYQKTIGK